ncbi:MAG: thermonuclease family protein [Gallionella sp.]|nr:thermonuclease family protein [Gallionella sp.]
MTVGANPFVAAIMLLLCAYSVQAETFTTQILTVLDGDTVLVKQGTGTLSIRLAEIDAPEKSQPFGETSKKSLSDLVMGKSVQVVSQTMDQYGRMVAHLNVAGLDVNAEQIRLGMAWEYSHFHNNQVLIALQKEAQSVPRGLWALSNPTPPWEWRKTHPYAEPASAILPATPLGMSCGNKKYCNQMTSCEEAKYYLNQCGVKRLDGNGDGVPCENLCAGQ